MSSLDKLDESQVKACKRCPFELLTPLIQRFLTKYHVRNQMYQEHLSDDKREMLEEHLTEALYILRATSETLKTLFGGPEGVSYHPILRDCEFVTRRYESVQRRLREDLAYEASIASLKESRLGIQQNQSVKKLTQLAFLFIPLSFITSVFGMNIDLLVGSGPKWWTVLIGGAIVYTLLAIPLLILRNRVGSWF